ncbi:uncharacterized protein Bfra_004803 [Botrytis fragariae]|uniref:Uncharacterized protein n=1 Tax=Botrytis fragariae TaxID=1964551 RepID=A0A8H6EIE0_9HELO|nr:uncharacterized protein Bfra_004803 [Botrytis fragariae]KAF5873346.1 hypothetical protein Bfra_004803 [Botrytis fragariae]
MVFYQTNIKNLRVYGLCSIYKKKIKFQSQVNRNNIVIMSYYYKKLKLEIRLELKRFVESIIIFININKIKDYINPKKIKNKNIIIRIRIDYIIIHRDTRIL